MNGSSQDDAFAHQVAIKLSRALNLVNPNDLLASRVIDITKSNTREGFVRAALGFGRFQDSFLEELYDEIASHIEKEHRAELAKPSHPTSQVAGVIVHDSEVLSPEPIREGGLVRKEKDKQHTFRLNKEKERSRIRTSLLGLDKLADEKRAQAAMNSGGSRKRQRLEDDGESIFKVPSVPAKRPGNARHRGEETPSHTGGVSEIAKARLEEYRRQREKTKGQQRSTYR